MADLSYYEKLCTGCMRPRGKQEGPCEHCGFDAAGYVSAPHHLSPRSIVNGKYLVGRVLGEGGFGITYIGFDLNLELRVAIKEYFPSGMVTRQVTGDTRSVTPFTGEAGEQYRKGLERFVGEAKTLAKFYALPGIVSVKDYFRENGTAYIVMEFVDGVTLKQTLKNRGGRLPVEETLSILTPVMESLAQVHNAGLIHRDISPDNIMLTERGAKLIDFGAAREYASVEERSRSVIFKMGYAPWEQYQTRGEQGPWTDVYALCATIYKCVTGETPPEALERMGEDSLSPPSRFGISILPQVEFALLKGLAVVKKDRYQDIPQLALALRGAAPEPAAKPSFSVVAEPKKALPKWLLPAAGCAAALVLVLVIALGGKEDSDLGPLEETAAPTPAITAAPAPEVVNTRGNTSINIGNLGYAAQQGDWIYFTEGSGGLYNTEGSGGLYKQRLDGTGRETLVESGGVECINVVGDQVYFRSPTGIMRIKTDGSDIEPLLSLQEDASVGYLHVVDDVMYYVVFQAGGASIYRMPIDGEAQVLYYSDNSGFGIMAVEEGWIYYIETTDMVKMTLMKMTLDGKQITSMVSATFMEAVQVAGDYIYYLDYPNLYRMDQDGANKTLVLEDVHSGFQVQGDWVYFISTEDSTEEMLCKARLDGSERTPLTSRAAIRACIVGDWVFYLDRYDEVVCRIKTDGTQNSYQAAPNAGEAQAPEPARAAGNTPGNSINAGLAVAYNGYIYYANRGDSYRIHRMNADGSGDIALNDTNSWNLNIADGTICFSNDSDGNRIYRMSVDGGPYERISEDACDQMRVVDGYIYYRNASDHNRLYRMRTDGLENELLFGDPVEYFNISDGYAYFAASDNGGRVTKLALDSGEIQVLTEPEMDGGYLNVADGYLYFCGDGTNGMIVRYDTDGAFDISWDEYELSSYMNVADDGYIYFYCYKDWNGTPGIYRTRYDGTEAEQIVEAEGVWNINVAGDWIFYRVNEFSSDDQTMYRIRTDGTQKELIG